MLDTVLQIGKALRASPTGLKHFQYVRPCPEDTDRETVFRIAIPVREDYTFDWENVYEINNEYELKKLYYLTFKTSNNDGLVKYMFGDIYYTRIAKIKTGNILFGEAGFFRLDNPQAKGVYKFNSFLRAEKDYQGIKVIPTELEDFRRAFKENYDYFEKILKYFPGIEDFLKEKAGSKNTQFFEKFIQNEEEILKYTGEAVFKKIKSSKSKAKDFKILFDDEKPEWDYVKNSEDKVKKLANFVSGSIFIHFQFGNNSEHKHWYDLKDAYKILKSKIFDDFVEESECNEESFVLKKTLYKTLCSGDEKNDMQFPGFKDDAKYKSRVFSKEDLQDLFYAIGFSEKGMISFFSTNLTLIVLPKGENLTAKNYEDFIDNGDEIITRRRNEKTNDDNFFVLLDASQKNDNITSFDMIFSKKRSMSAPGIDFIELRGIQKSSLNQIRKRINRIKDEVYKKRTNELFTDKKLSYFSVFQSIQNILGSPQTNNKGKVQFKANPKYQSHLLKIIPKIYTGNYYLDPILLPTFIENVEFSIRAGDPKYIWLKYDLELLIKLQNTSTEGEHFMEIINSTSYKTGLLLGKMARNFSGENSPIKSFEKNYVGNLTRRISNLKDLIDFKNDLEQKLIMHEKINFVRKEANELANLIKSHTEGEYDKNKCAFGFFETYFAPFKKLNFIEKIQNQLDVYKNENDSDSTLIEEMENLILKYEK